MSLTQERAAECLSVSVKTVLRLVRDGELAADSVGRFDIAEVEALQKRYLREGRSLKKIEHVRQGDVAPFIDGLIAMIERGKSLSQACAASNGPNLNAVRRWLRDNPDHNARVKAARLAAGGCARFGSRIPPEAWEAGLRSVATHDGPLTVLRIPGQPHIDELRRRADKDVAFAVRLKAAFAERESAGIRKGRFSADDYERAVSLLEDRTRTMAAIDADLRRQNLPTLGTIYVRKQRDGDLASQFAERITATRGIFHFTDEAYAEAISILATDPLNARRRIADASGRLPSFNAIRGRAAASPHIAAMFSDYREQSRAGRAERRANQARLKRANKPVYRDGVLRSGLLLNDLYREASALFHAGIPDRDDMITEVVLVALQDKLTLDDVKKRGKAIGFSAMKSTGKLVDSLDRTLSRDGSGSTMLELMTSDHWSFEDAI